MRVRPSGNDVSLSLDWVSLGRLVRQRTLDLVAAHFVALDESLPEEGNDAETRSEQGGSQR